MRGSFKRMALLGLSLLFAGACIASEASSEDQELARLMRPGGDTGNQVDVEMGLSAVRQAAFALALNRGYVFEAKRINAKLDRAAAELDRVFPFGDLVEDGLLPPVVDVAEDAETVDASGRRVLRTGVKYKVRRPARMVLAPPTWREYLLLDANDQGRGVVDAAWMPKNSAEMKAWRAGIRAGWEEGKRLAHRHYRLKLNRLQADIAGMLRALRLMEQGVLSRARLNRIRRDVVIDPEKRTLLIGQELLSIEDDSGFQPAESWNPVLVDERNMVPVKPKDGAP